MKKGKLAYGTGTQKFVLPAEILPGVVKPNTHPGLSEPLAEVRRTLSEPIGSAPLAIMLKKRKPKNVVIVVNDVTRPTPYNILFPPLLETFAEAGVQDDQVTLLVATGFDREKVALALNRKPGCNSYSFINPNVTRISVFRIFIDGIA